jgi:ATP-dependent Clp protease ATP-binding subunit ClpC
MDEAGSRARIGTMTRPPATKDSGGRDRGFAAKKKASIKAQDFEKAAALRDSEKKAKGGFGNGSLYLEEG